jgi:flagellar biosynthesis protein FlhF
MRRFVASTARDCLRRVKAELGPDAIVVSNRPVEGGVEIMAMTSESFEALSRQMPTREMSPPPAPVPAAMPAPALAARVAAPVSAPTPTPAAEAARRAYAQTLATPLAAASSRSSPPPPPLRAQPASRATIASTAEDDYTVSLSAQSRKPPLAQPTWASPARAAAPDDELADLGRSRLRPLPGRTASAATLTPNQTSPPSQTQAAPAEARLAPAGVRVAAEQAVQEDGMRLQVNQLMGEMHTIKSLLERQLAGFAWGEISRESPVRAQALSEMLDAGFSGLLARKLCEELPSELNIEDARKWLKSALNRHLRTLGNDNDIIDRGGIYALVGPTGVGKTTTTAKLAARCVVRYGADKIALLTTDGYRIGAHEQLRIYGRILGVPVHVVRDGDDLRHTLADLRDKHMVLIDTVGMSQRDRMVAEQAAMLTRAGEVNRLLLLNATVRGDTLDDVVRAYAGEDLAGVILSKVDETASIAPALDAVIRHGLMLCYVANGQRVPEDMHLPNRNYLMHRAFKQPGEASPHRLQMEETGLIMTSPDMARKTAGAGRG